MKEWSEGEGFPEGKGKGEGGFWHYWFMTGETWHLACDTKNHFFLLFPFIFIFYFIGSTIPSCCNIYCLLYALVTCDRWHMKHGIWRVTQDTWHMTPDMLRKKIYWLYYPHTSRQLVPPVCGIFTHRKTVLKIAFIIYTFNNNDNHNIFCRA